MKKSKEYDCIAALRVQDVPWVLSSNPISVKEKLYAMFGTPCGYTGYLRCYTIQIQISTVVILSKFFF